MDAKNQAKYRVVSYFLDIDNLRFNRKVRSVSTILIAYLFTALIFGFFIYYFVWRNRYVTQIRLSVYKVEGRVVSIERVVREIHVNEHQNLLALKRIEWKVIYKDRNDNLRETRCRVKGGQLDWHPPLG